MTLTNIFFYVPEHPIFFSKELQSQELDEGKVLMLCCEISDPGTSVQWKKDTVLLWPGNKYEMKQNGCELGLRIYDFNTEDCGVYMCCASKVETTATIGIIGLSSYCIISVL